MTNTQSKTTGKTPLNHFPGDPNNLLDALLDKLGLKNDAALSRLLEVAPPVISKLRHGVLPIGPTILIRIHEVSNMGIREMRALMLKNEPRPGETIEHLQKREQEMLRQSST